MPDPLDRDRSIEDLLRQTLRASAAATSCLDAEQLAAWAAGGMAQPEAAAAKQHLADCSDCQAMLAAFVESEPAPVVVESPVVLLFRQRWRATWLVPAAAAAAAVFVWVAVTREPTQLPPSVTTMARVEKPSPAPPAALTGGPEVSSQLRGAATADRPVPLEPQLQPGRSAPVAAPPFGAANAAARQGLADETLSPAPFESSRIAGSGAKPSATDNVVASAPAPVASPPSPAPSPEVAAVPRRFEAARALVAPTSSALMDARGRLDQAAVLPAHARAGEAGAAQFGAPASGATTQEAAPATRAVRWRIEVTGSVVRSADGGLSWGAVLLAPSTFITAGSAPVAGVCWLAGRNGTVWRSTDDATFVPVAFTEAGAVAAIQARDASAATVTMAGGRAFSTTDGGRTWRALP